MLTFQIIVDRLPLSHIVGESAVVLNVHVFVAPVPIAGIFSDVCAGKGASIQLLLQGQGRRAARRKDIKVRVTRGGGTSELDIHEVKHETWPHTHTHAYKDIP